MHNTLYLNYASMTVFPQSMTHFLADCFWLPPLSYCLLIKFCNVLLTMGDLDFRYWKR